MTRSLILAILSSLLLVLAYPLSDFWGLAWAAMVPLLFALDGKTPRAAFGWAYLTGFLFFAGTLSWFIHVTLPGMVLLMMYLALYFGFFGLGYAYFQKLPPSWRIGILPALWVALEFIRDRFLSGFGWVCLGHSQYQVLPVIQIAEFTGVFGVSFLVMMVNVVLKEMIKNRCWKTGGIPGLFFLLVLGYGALIVSITYAPKFGMKIAVIQPNVEQHRKWLPSSWDEITERLLALTGEAARHNPDLIIWPETAFPGFIWESPERFERIKDFTARQKIPLLLGAVTKVGERYYNSAILISGEGAVAAQYNKLHLVPFGEYVPFRRQLPFLSEIVPIADFSAGTELTRFPISQKSEPRPGEKNFFSALICFEDTVAGTARAMTRQGADFLVNITNDAWFQDTQAPFLHLQAAVFQAVANRRSMVRAANTGVSGFIDEKGFVYSFVQDKTGKKTMRPGYVVDGIVRTRDGMSFYARFGDVFAYLCFSAVILGVIKRKISL